MTFAGWLEIALFLAILTALTPLVGGYMARVFTDEVGFLGFVERPVYRLLGVRRERGQDWKAYGRSVLVFSVLGFGLLYLVLRTQSAAPVQPAGPLLAHLGPLLQHRRVVRVEHELAVLRAARRRSRTSRRCSASRCRTSCPPAVGIAVLAAFIRGLASRSTRELGNFYVDLTRVLLYILLPLSVLGGLFLVSQGVLQSLSAPTHVHTLTGLEQTLVQGPVASQEAIKLLGTNGGGFFNVNSAMPFENPTWLTNFVEMLMILVIPAGLTATYGRMVGSRRQGWAVFAAMMILFVAAVALVYAAESPRDARDARRRRLRPATWRARSSASASRPPRCSPRSPRPPPAAR